MYHLACGSLAVIALILNCLDRRMFWLTALVIASILVPAPMSSAEAFYTFCAVFDLSIAFIAWRAGGAAGAAIADICLMLVVSHIFGYVRDGSLPFSPYHLVVKLLEASQLAVCVILSPSVSSVLHNRDAPTST